MPTQPLHLVLVALLASTIAASCGKSRKTAVEHEKRARVLIGELEAIGVKFDSSKLHYELATPAQARSDFDKQQDMFFRPSYFQGMWTVRRSLGLPAGKNGRALRNGATAQLGSKLSAYFQDDRGALVFLENDLTKLSDMDQLVAHELVHAYQSQTVGGLESYLERATLDRTNAAHGALEGAAEMTAVAVLLNRKHKTLADMKVESLDPQLARLLVGEHTAALYDVGSRYILRRFHDGSWNPSHPIAGEPPPSTEQLMHPEKLGNDEPTDVQLSGADQSSGDKPIYSDVMGELNTYLLLLELGVERQRARRVVAGWDGDRFAAYRTVSGGWGLAWRLVWDRALDAMEFEKALPTAIGAARHGNIVDIAAGSDDTMRSRMRAIVAAAPAPPQPPARDGETTAAVENAIREETEKLASVKDGWWVHDKHGVRVPIPQGFAPTVFNNVQVLASAPKNGFANTITVIATANPTGAGLDEIVSATRKQFEAMAGVELIGMKKATYGNQEVGEFEYKGAMPGQDARFHAFGVIALRAGKQVVISAITLEDDWAANRDTLVAAIHGTVFD